MSLQSVYNLSEITEFARLLNDSASDTEDNSPINVTNYSTKSNEKYRIVRYDKNSLNKNCISKYGLLRSVIINDANRVVCFSPPKSLLAEQFLKMYPLPNDNEKNSNENDNEEKPKHIIAQDFIEGTMINVFFDPSVGLTGCWQIATRSTVGANVTFFKGATKTFN